MSKTATTDARSEPLSGALHDVSNSITSLGGAARTLVAAGDRMDAPLRDELGALVLRQVEHLSWLVDAMREITDPSDHRDGIVDTANLVRSAASIAEIAVRIDGTAAVSGDVERLRLGLEAVLDAVARRDAVVSLDRTGRTMTVVAGPADLSFGGIRWRLALARRLLSAEGASLSIAADDGVTRVVIEFAAASIIRI